eukprot:gene45462-66028_t
MSPCAADAAIDAAVIACLERYEEAEEAHAEDAECRDLQMYAVPDDATPSLLVRARSPDPDGGWAGDRAVAGMRMLEGASVEARAQRDAELHRWYASATTRTDEAEHAAGAAARLAGK